MTWKDIQYIIPGWNIIYATRMYRAFNRKIKQQQTEFKALREQGNKDLLLADSYAKQRDTAKQKGDLETAAKFNNKIAEMALSHIENIK